MLSFIPRAITLRDYKKLFIIQLIINSYEAVISYF